MTQASQVAISDALQRVLGRIAPEADLSTLDHAADIRDQLDIDSVDFLNFVLGLHEELGIDVPEADYGKLRSLQGCIAYLSARLDGKPPA
jgi:acyl carrier protein